MKTYFSLGLWHIIYAKIQVTIKGKIEINKLSLIEQKIDFSIQL